MLRLGVLSSARRSGAYLVATTVHFARNETPFFNTSSWSSYSEPPYQLASDSPPLPAFAKNHVDTLLDNRDDRREMEMYKDADYLFRRPRREFGIRKVDDRRRLFWVFDNQYEDHDFLEFTQDEASPPAPYWVESEDKMNDHIESALQNFQIFAAQERSCQRRSVEYTGQSSQSCLLDLARTYGVKVDIDKKVWTLTEGFVSTLPLKHRTLREELAQVIEESLSKNGFSRLDQEDRSATSFERQVDCRIYERPLARQVVPPEIRSVTLRVRSSIELYSDEVTESGAQPIHVYLEYSQAESIWSHERMIFKSKRIVRKGKLENIVKRLEERIRDVEASVDEIEICPRCGEAPLFKSRKGNWVCSHFCWVSSEREKQELAEDVSEKLLEKALKLHELEGGESDEWEDEDDGVEDEDDESEDEHDDNESEEDGDD